MNISGKLFLTHPSTHLSGSIGLTNEVFSEEVAPLLLRDVSCTGTESTLLNCTHNTRPQYLCGRFEDAGVVCQGVCACVCVYMYVCVNHVNLFQMLLVTLKMHDV